MQGNNFIKPEEILKATNGGLDIIFELYPDASDNTGNPKKKFKARGDEHTASASLKKIYDAEVGCDVYLVTDFGSDSKTRNGILCWALEKRIDWQDALAELAAKYNVTAAGNVQAAAPKAIYTVRDAEPDEEEGRWTFKIRETGFTDQEIETVFSRYTLKAIGWDRPDKKKEKDKPDAYAVVKEACKKYHFYPLISYTMIKDRQAKTFEATPDYPIFLVDEGSHKKIYQPKSFDKAYRFMYYGSKPKDFIHGLLQAEAEMARRVSDANQDAGEEVTDDKSEEQAKVEKKKVTKIKDIILASGISDALNLAVLGEWVLWMNSETAKLPGYQYNRIKELSYKVYQLQDIDDTGRRSAHELSLEYLDLHTIVLPEELKKFKDRRGNPCKDLRDYLNHYNEYKFSELKRDALPYRFWDQVAQYNGRGDSRYFAGYTYEFRNVRAYNFLNRMGFYRLPVEGRKTEYIYVHLDGNIVREKTANKVKNFIHEFLKERRVDEDLRDTLYKSAQLNESSLSNLEETVIDFKYSDEQRQYMFFDNGSWEITATDIIPHKPGRIKSYVWENDVIGHSAKLEESPFTVELRPDGLSYDIKVNHHNCMFFNFLIQTSRIHWRKELEVKLEELPKDQQEKYKLENKFNIAGPLLTAEEREEQKQHLLNKLFAFGYIMHRYKDRAKTWAVVAMDNRMNSDGRSYGGSGKSLIWNQAISKVLKTLFKIPGTNPQITQNPHIFHGLNKQHQAIIVDDADKYLNFRFFFELITGDQMVNPKNAQQYEVPFEDLAKLIWLTNFAFLSDGSTNRRILYTVCSDLFHTKSDTDDYRSSWEPKDEFGKSLFTQFDEKEWNFFYNTAARALQFFLQCPFKLNPPMDNVTKRNLRREMGEEFEAWANVYFSEIGDNLDRYVIKALAYANFLKGKPKTFNYSSNKFKSSMEAFCRFNNYVFNPDELLNTKDGRIMHRVKKFTDNGEFLTSTGDKKDQKEPTELIYVQTKFDKPVNTVLPGEEALPF